MSTNHPLSPDDVIAVRERLNALLTLAVERRASDIHLRVGEPPCLRVRGDITRVGEERLGAAEMEHFVEVMLPRGMVWTDFERELEADFAYAVPGLCRFRVNVFMQRGSCAAVLRAISSTIKSIDELGLPPVLKTLAEAERGILLVTGPTGSGKSTTLAAMIDHINATLEGTIVTLEDPIETVHPNKKCVMAQRELGTDTRSFMRALRGALRQDPDVILIGEMRDKETVEAALSAAQTGHLVMSTLHTIDAPRTIQRVIDFFEPHERPQIRLGLSEAFVGAVSQRLVPTRAGGRAAGLEILVGTARVRECIKDESKTGDLGDAMAEGGEYGMQSFEQHMARLVEENVVRYRDALGAASSPNNLRTMLMQRGFSDLELKARDLED